jgi:hypothetical protein
MKNSISITIDNIDNIKDVLKSLELLFAKLIHYYAGKDNNNLEVLIVSVSIYFGKMLRLLGYNEDNPDENNNEGESWKK